MRGMKLKSFIVALGAAFALSAGSANALLVFFGEDAGLGEALPLPVASRINSTVASNQFLSSLIGVGTENFEGFATGAAAPLNLTFPGAGSATLNGAGFINTVAPGSTNGFGRYGTSGSNYWETSSNNFSITFGAPVAAFGFWGIDIGDFNGQVTVQLVGGGAQLLNVGNTVNGPGGSVLFYGIIAQGAGEQFTGITFGNTAAGVDGFGFDDMTIGSIEQVRIPEPGTLLLFGLAALGAVGARKLRRT